MPDSPRIELSASRLQRARAVQGPRAAGAAGSAPGVGADGWIRPGAENAWLQRERHYAGLRDGAVLLARMIDQMGGGASSLPRGAFVSLDA
ncbi:MAG: hypothetical protein AB7Q81_04835 [Gammaproteobacteria bacterium]